MSPPYCTEVYHLDLCILAYQLHAQALAIPFDPYWEGSENRTKLMRRAAEGAGKYNRSNGPSKEGVLRGSAAAATYYRGNSSGVGWSDNPKLDTYLYDYTRISPWHPGYTRPNSTEERLLYYKAPREITDRIKSVYVAQFSAGTGPNSTTPSIEFVGSNGIPTTANAARALVERPVGGNALQNSPVGAALPKDLLFCFEGGTGGNEPSSNHEFHSSAYSLMGFCLAQENANNNYDVHIVFRGSRSGKTKLMKNFVNDKGNPDWVTDLDYATMVKDPVICEPQQRGGRAVSRGFAQSVKTCFPTILACLNEIQRQKRRPPENITVTGHSLGAALASLFVSSVLLGDDPNHIWPATWQWQDLKLYTYAPPALTSSHHANKTGLKDRFSDFANGLNAQTKFPIPPHSPRKFEQHHFAVAGDWIAFRNRAWFYHVGHVQIVGTINGTTPVEMLKKAHSPNVIRQQLINWLLGQVPVPNPPLLPADALNPPFSLTDGPWQEFNTLSELLTEMTNANTADFGANHPNIICGVETVKRYLYMVYPPPSSGPDMFANARSFDGNLKSNNAASPAIDSIRNGTKGVLPSGYYLNKEQSRAVLIGALMAFVGRGDNQYTDFDSGQHMAGVVGADYLTELSTLNHG